MSKILINRDLFSLLENKNSNMFLYSLPVRCINVCIEDYYEEEINALEKPVLNLFFNKFYDTETISNILALDKRLITKIITSLQDKGLIDSKYKLTKKGIECVESKKTSEGKIGLLFYNYKTEQFINEIFNEEDFEEFELFKLNNNINIEASSYNKGKFVIEQDAFDITVSPISLIAEKTSDKEKMDKFKKEFNSIQELFAEKFKITALDNGQDIRILGCAIENKDETDYKQEILGNYNWYFVNPFSSTKDIDNVQNLLIADENIHWFKNLMSKKIKEAKKDTTKYELIKSNTNEFVITVKNKINSLIFYKYKNKEEISLNSKRINNMLFTDALVNSVDIWETLIHYFKTRISPKIENIISEQVTISPEMNLDTLNNLLSKYHYNKISQTNFSFNFNKKNLLTNLNRQNLNLKRDLTLNILALFLDNANSSLFGILRKKYKGYENLINDILYLKDLRNQEKHNDTINKINLDKNVDQLLNCLNILFNVCEIDNAANLVKAMEIKTYLDKTKIISYIEVVLGHDFINQTRFSTLKELCINLVIEILNKENCRTTTLNKIMDSLIKKIAKVLYQTYKLDTSELFNNEFSTSDKIISFMKHCGFETSSYSLFSNKIEKSYEPKKVSEKIQNAISTNFNKSMLLENSLYILSIMYYEQTVLNEFTEFKDLFILISTAKVETGHQQTTTFDEEKAQFLKDKVLDFVKFIITRQKYII